MLRLKAHGMGFTIIELMVALMLFSLLAVMAAPEFSLFLQNQKVRSKAESITSALQTARQEALRLNTTVTFALVTALPATGDTALAANAAGQDWVVAQVPVPAAPVVVFKSQLAQEGGGQAPTVLAVAPAAGAAVVFNPLGSTNQLATARFSISGPGGAANCLPGGTFRCMAVEVSPTGQILMCDPLINAPGDTRKCPTTI